MANRRDGKETQEQVLEAALEVFARKGYRETTVAEICRAAGANVAAVNYHFGGKEQLYAEVWQRAFAPARARAMLDEGLGAEASAEGRLRALLGVMFSRIQREGGQSLSGRLLLNEMAQPSAALHEVKMKATEPIRSRVRQIVEELLGDGARKEQVNLCALSVMHQVLAIGFRGGRKPPFLGSGPFADEEIEALIEHTYQFSLGGIAAIARLNGTQVAADGKGAL